MMTRISLLALFRSATMLVIQAVAGRMNLKHFIEAYDNFYYFNALDGHEDSDDERAVMREFEKLIRFHEAVQAIVDTIYWGPEEQREAYLAAGRMLPEDGEKRLRECVAEHAPMEEIERLANKLQDVPNGWQNTHR